MDILQVFSIVTKILNFQSSSHNSDRGSALNRHFCDKDMQQILQSAHTSQSQSMSGNLLHCFSSWQCHFHGI